LIIFIIIIPFLFIVRDNCRLISVINSMYYWVLELCFGWNGHKIGFQMVRMDEECFTILEFKLHVCMTSDFCISVRSTPFGC
jgi:hypothetical protein